MPIGGFVINIDMGLKEDVLSRFADYSQLEVHGVDDKGNVVAVIDTENSEEMERLTAVIQKIEGVLSLGVTYFDAEDEVEKIAQGQISPTFSFGRKGEKSKSSS